MPFRDIYGQEKQIDLIKTALIGGSLPQAFVFQGIAGIGKTKTALALAKALNCPSFTIRADACGSCNSCKRIDDLNHPDVSVVKPQGQFIRISQVRDLQLTMRYKPFEGRIRVTILSEADRLSQEAAGALLKTMEEPPKDNLLILITSRPDKLPLTIHSRSRRISFNPLTRNTIFSYLTEVKSKAPEVALIASSAAGGSIGRSLDLLDTSFLVERKKLIDQFSRPNFDDLFDLVARLGRDKEEVVEKLTVLKSFFRDVLYRQVRGTSDGIINLDYAAEIASLACELSPQEPLARIEAIDRAINNLERNANLQLTLETMMIKIGAPKRNSS